MILTHLKISNFGIYGDSPILELTPNPETHFNRPIVLFSGKNGVGKTTFVEAIRVCLHGASALGARVSKRQYEEYLIKKVHNKYQTSQEPLNRGASLELAFEYVSAGRSYNYLVKRQWEVSKEKTVSEELTILEDGAPPAGLQRDQYESFLKDIIPPAITDLFFFDGEKIDQLIRVDTSSSVLAESIKGLLGINLVEQLQKDLEVFIARQSGGGDTDALSQALHPLKAELEELLLHKKELIQAQENNQTRNAELQNAIEQQEQRIANQGGSYAKRFSSLKQERIWLEKEIDIQSRKIQELCSGLVPFAVAPKMLRKVADRFKLEQEYSQVKAAEEVLSQQMQRLKEELISNQFWIELDLNLPQNKINSIAKSLIDKLIDSSLVKKIDSSEIVNFLSEQDQVKLTTWIDQALHEAPQSFSAAVSDLIKQQNELRKVVSEINMTPADLIIQPMIDALNKFIEEKETAQHAEESIAREIGAIEYKINQLQARIKAIEEELLEKKRSQRQVELAIRSIQALQLYATQLTNVKIQQLEEHLLKRFEEMVRKINFIDKIKMDLDTFQITLFRRGTPFGRDQLSAGEKQLLAVATIWALRDISGNPMPVIIDTPLGRLDSEHRLSMIQDYFPKASHQVILLATDTELDYQMITELEPAISHGYLMEFSEAIGATVISPLQKQEEPFTIEA